MNRIKVYENNIVKKKFRLLFLIILLLQILSLTFFALVGIYDDTDTSGILQSPRGIVSLALTLTVAIISMYTITILNKYLVIKFIGNFRERTYVLPLSRKEIFNYRFSSFLKLYSRVLVEFTLIPMVVYFVFSKLVFNNIKIEDSWYLLVITIFVLGVSLFIIIISISFGIAYHSTSVSIISGVILICLLGNLIAQVYILNELVILLLSLLILVINYLIYKYLINRISKDSLLNVN